MNPHNTVPGASGAAGTVRISQLSEATLPPLDRTIPPWPGRRVQVGGASIFVRHTPSTDPAGPAEPALFVHGLGGSSTNWTDLADLLSPWLESDALDLPGFGRSAPAPDKDYSMRAMTNTVVAYLEQSGRGPVHLFGNSMGGLVSILVAASRPDLVRTLTLVSPGVPDLRPRRVAATPLPLLLVPGVGELALRRYGQVSAARRVQGMTSLCFADPSNFPPGRVAEAIDEARERAAGGWGPDAMLRSLRGLVGSHLVAGETGIWRRMATIAAPTLVVWGDRDKLVHVSLAPKVARVIPDARMLVLTGVGHVAQMEDPVSTARAFLQLRSDATNGV